MPAETQATPQAAGGQPGQSPARPARVVAFLQCLWVRDPERVRAIYARHAGDMRRRAELNARFLFRESTTGRRLRGAFGELCGRIVWEEVTTQIGGESRSVFPPDPDHIRRVLAYHKPDAVLVFGKVARDGVVPIVYREYPNVPVIPAPHPAARRATVPTKLLVAAELVRTAREAVSRAH